MTSRRTHTALDIFKLVHLGSARSHLEFHVIRRCSATLWKKAAKAQTLQKTMIPYAFRPSSKSSKFVQNLSSEPLPATCAEK